MRKATFTIFLATAFSTSAFGADRSGQYWNGGGVGAAECPAFVASMERARKHGIGTAGYVNETQGAAMFLAGFQIAYNKQTPATCDIFNGLSYDQLLAWTENFCRQNPLEKYSSAVTALAAEVAPKRLKTCQ
jgi:hypothetical protein